MASGPAPKGRTHGCTDQARDVKISLANPEQSTHGTKRPFVLVMSGYGTSADGVAELVRSHLEKTNSSLKDEPDGTRCCQ
jgi:hypothetical protein